jgi:hypothetical protein
LFSCLAKGSQAVSLFQFEQEETEETEKQSLSVFSVSSCSSFKKTKLATLPAVMKPGEDFRASVSKFCVWFCPSFLLRVIVGGAQVPHLLIWPELLTADGYRS